MGLNCADGRTFRPPVPRRLQRVLAGCGGSPPPPPPSGDAGRDWASSLPPVPIHPPLAFVSRNRCPLYTGGCRSLRAREMRVKYGRNRR